MHMAALLARKGGSVVTVTPDTSVADACALMTERRIGAVLVMDGPSTDAAAIKGILSERDVVKTISVQGAAALDRRAAEVMTRDVETCHPGQTVTEVMARMTEGRFRHMPVVEDGRLLGIVSIGDVVKRRLDDAEVEVETLREYVGMIAG